MPRRCYERYASALRTLGVRVATGRFRAMMEVEILGDGPVTILLDEPRSDLPADAAS